MAETMLVIQGYKNLTINLDDTIYVANVEDAETDGYDFQTAVMNDEVEREWELVPAGSVSVPVYKVVRKVSV